MAKNDFRLTSGKDGRPYIHELTRLLASYSEITSLEQIALKCVVRSSKSPFCFKYHIRAQKQRIILSALVLD